MSTSTESPDLPTSILVHESDDVDEREETGRGRMSFLEHLDELRRRIIYSLYAIAGACGVTFWFVHRLSGYLLGYFSSNGGKLIYTKLTEGFMFDVKVGALAGVILASPFVFYQFWLFVAPGLYAREKKVVIPFVASATVLFGSGVWFAHVIAFPSMYRFFASFSTDAMQGLFTISEVFSFYVHMVLALGVVFELPVLVFFLARFGIVTASFLLKKAKYAIVIIFILAAMISPSPDPFNQCIMAAPMLVLYGLSIGVAKVFGKKPDPGSI
jgi:sec-independent protein translocase protein TatC